MMIVIYGCQIFIVQATSGMTYQIFRVLIEQYLLYILITSFWSLADACTDHEVHVWSISVHSTISRVVRLSPGHLIINAWVKVKILDKLLLTLQNHRQGLTVHARNTNWKKRLSTLDLVIQVACFVTNVIHIFDVKLSRTKLISTRRSTVLNHPL
jgi:hypothetical protein